MASRTQVPHLVYRFQSITDASLDGLEAIQRITGAVPAFMRPRASTSPTLSSFFSVFLPFAVVAYGNYNDLMLTVAGQRGQSVVNWDFE